MIAALAFAKPALRVLLIAVPIPVALIVAAALWVWLDKRSAVRLAVDKAVTELVAGADLRAAEARLAEEQKRRAAAEAAFAAYLKILEEEMAADEARREQLEQELAGYEEELAAEGRACLLDGADLDFLRNTGR